MSNKRGLTILHPTVQVSYKAWEKMWALTEAKTGRKKDGKTGKYKNKAGKHGSNVELSAYLVAEQETPNLFVVEDVVVVSSEGTGGSTVMNHEEDIAELAKEGKHELLSKLKGWFHRHPGGGRPMWSSQDEKQMEEFGDICPWLISIVTNSGDRDNYRARIDFFEPYRMYVDNIELEVAEHPKVVDAKQEIQSEIREIRDHIQDEVDKKVKVKTFVSPQGHALVGYRGERSWWNKKFPSSKKSSRKTLKFNKDTGKMEEVNDIRIPSPKDKEEYDAFIANQAAIYLGGGTPDIPEEELERILLGDDTDKLLDTALTLVDEEAASEDSKES